MKNDQRLVDAVQHRDKDAVYPCLENTIDQFGDSTGNWITCRICKPVPQGSRSV